MLGCMHCKADVPQVELVKGVCENCAPMASAKKKWGPVQWIVYGAAIVAAIWGAFYVKGNLFPISASERGAYGEACEMWIADEFGNGRETRLGDSWRKSGRLVFEVMLLNEGKTSYTPMLCVVDTSSGEMLKPSVFDQQWR